MSPYLPNGAIYCPTNAIAIKTDSDSDSILYCPTTLNRLLGISFCELMIVHNKDPHTIPLDTTYRQIKENVTSPHIRHIALLHLADRPG